MSVSPGAFAPKPLDKRFRLGLSHQNHWTNVGASKPRIDGSPLPALTGPRCWHFALPGPRCRDFAVLHALARPRAASRVFWASCYLYEIRHWFNCCLGSHLPVFMPMRCSLRRPNWGSFLGSLFEPVSMSPNCGGTAFQGLFFDQKLDTFSGPLSGGVRRR